MVNTGNLTYQKLGLCTECTDAWKEIRHKSQQEIESKIEEYLATPIPIQGFLRTSWLTPLSQGSRTAQSAKTTQTIQKPIEEIVVADTVPPNAAAQKKAAKTIDTSNKKLTELQQIYNSTTDLEIRHSLLIRITNLKEILHGEAKKIKILKRQARYQKKSRAKKAKILEEHQEVVKYDSPGRPPLLIQYPELHEHIHECIEFGAADKKRRKEVIKVRTISHLREALNSKYNEYLSRTTLNNYLLPHRSTTISAKAHHHPANIAIASVSRNEKMNTVTNTIVLLQ